MLLCMSIFAPTSTVARDRRRFAARRLTAGLHGRLQALDQAPQISRHISTVTAAWPAALNRQQASAYSGLAPAFLRRLAKEGRLVFRPIGPNGSKVVLRAELDRILSENLGAEMKGTGIEEDFDFG